MHHRTEARQHKPAKPLSTNTLEAGAHRHDARPDTLAKRVLSQFLKNKLAVFGAVILLLVISAAILAPFIAPHDPSKINLLQRLAAPSLEFPLGTDIYGRDIFSRILYGAQISLLVGFASMAGAVMIGTIVGALAGYYGGKTDAFLMRVVDVLVSFPNIFLLITIISIFRPGVDKLIFVFALFSWMTTARLVRGEFLSLKKREYVLAAKTVGMSDWRIIFSEMLPNAIGPIIVTATLGVGHIIIAESALSFLGLGVQPPTPSWGNMLHDAQGYSVMRTAWWVPFFPGLMIFVTVLCFNFVGDGLRDAFDPNMK